MELGILKLIKNYATRRYIIGIIPRWTENY